MVKHRRDLAIGGQHAEPRSAIMSLTSLSSVCSIAACAQVNVLVSEAITALEPVLADIENTVADIAGKTEEELANILFASFSTVESTLATLVGTIGGIAPGGLLPLNKREVLSNADVANTLAALLQGVANAVNLVETSTAGLVSGFPHPVRCSDVVHHRSPSSETFLRLSMLRSTVTLATSSASLETS